VHALSGERILIAWERGLSMPEPWRPLALLEQSIPGSDLTSLAAMPLPERNARLLELRALSFGRSIDAFARCPHCDAPLEFELNTDNLHIDTQAPTEETWMEGGSEMHMRLANTTDLAAAHNAVDDDEACARLLSLTMGLASFHIDPKDHTDWLARFDQLNAAAEIRCVLTCDACAARAEIDFDIAAFFWREIASGARRLLAEIHGLASAYGWSEHSILAMSPARRRAYLEMLHS